MIVLKENEWAKHMIDNCELGKKPSETLRRVARYYIDNGYSKREARRELDKFIINSGSDKTPACWSDMLDFVTKIAWEKKAVDIDFISITYPELEKIATLESRPAKRLAFTLLCLSKYYSKINKENGGWVNDKGSHITAMANIKTAVKNQGKMYRELKEKGLVQFSNKIDSNSVKVLFVEDGEVALKITDFRNLGYQYLMYCGEPYFKCANCGLIVKLSDPKNRRKQKYCPECAYKIALQQRVKSVAKRNGFVFR